MMNHFQSIHDSSQPDIPLQSEIIPRIFWLIHLRYLAVIGVLGVLLTCLAMPVRIHYIPQATLLLFLLCCNAALHKFAIAFREGKANLSTWQRFAQIQILIDFAILTLQLHYAGGLENPFSLYYVFHTAFAGLLLPIRAAFFSTFLGMFMFAGLILGEGFGFLTHYPLFEASPLPFDANIAQNTISRQGDYANPWIMASILIPLSTCMVFMTYLTSSIARVIGLKERHQHTLQINLEAQTDKLARLNRQLKEHMKNREQFLYTVEHELKSPLSAIRSNLEAILAAGDSLSTPMKDMLRRSSQRTQGLLSLVHDLLKISRLEYEFQKEEKELIHLSQMVQDEVEFFRSMAEEKNLTLHAEIENGIHITGPSLAAKYITDNLISNAVRYTQQGGITVSLTQYSSLALFRVEDSGIGIEPEEQERIFQDFYRTQTAKETIAEGTGLGLSLVKRSVDALHGTIEITSQVGEGTAFSLSLPLAHEDSLPS